ncbi:MAG: YiiX/YebB-like N1pC/P60 family cysteine hydrolase [Pseudohongiellaceae bacterium]
MFSIKQAIATRLVRFLTRPLSGYQRIDTVSIDEVAATIRTADIVLVEGNTRISTAIKYLTQSSWSHACLYVGQDGEPPTVGNLLEADLNAGVRLVSLKHYEGFNLRLCRPVGLTDEEKQQLVAFATSRLGHQYDLRNVFDLVRYLIQKPAVPNRYRRVMLGLGSGEPTRAICSTLIAESFQAVDYPILPHRTGEIGRDGEVPQYYRRHFTHFTPRDFDLSPYFHVVKPTLEKGFDHNQLQWREPE